MGYTFKVQSYNDDPEKKTEACSVKQDFSKMSKIDLEKFGRTIGIELDRRLSKSKLIEQLEEAINV